LAFTGTIPASLITPAGVVTAYFGRGAAGNYFQGFLDDWRFHTTSALDTSVLNAQTVYTYDSATWTDGYDFDGDADSREGVMPNGVVTGASQWYDGRQPEGLLIANPCERDRATGINQTTEGTYGIRGKYLAANASVVELVTVALTEGRWTVLVGQVREASANAQLQFGAQGAFPAGMAASIPTQATMADVGVAGRVVTSAAARMQARVFGSSEAYFDDLRALQLAVLTPTVANRGVPTRVIWSTSIPGETKPYIYVALTADEEFLGGVRNDAGTVYEAGEDTAPGIGYRTVALTWDLTTLTAYVDGVVETSTSNPVGTTTGLTEQTLGAVRLAITGHGFDDDIGDVIEWSRALDAADVLAAHNQLKRLFKDLA